MLHQIRVSGLSEWEVQRVIDFLKTISPKLITAPNWKIIHVHGKVLDYWKRAPGVVKLEQQLGKQFFSTFAILVSLGMLAYEDSMREDLRPTQKMGRAFLHTGLSLSPISFLYLGAKIVAPKWVDEKTAWCFSGDNPIVDKLADVIVKRGDTKFQEWSSKPHWLDFF